MGAAEAAVRAAGYECISLGDRVEGEARDVAAAHARLAREFRAQSKHAVIISGGELTVTIRGKGRGGPIRNMPWRWRLRSRACPQSLRLPPTPTARMAARDATDPAGAFVDGESVARARARGLDPAAFLADNNSTGFFSALGDLLVPGPTYTNVNDFRAIIVDRP